MEGFDKLSPAQQQAKLEEIASEVRNFSGSPDFARHGASARVRELNQIFMFLNARIQGTAGDLLSKIVGRDVPKGKRAAAAIATSSKLLTTIALPSLALEVYNNVYHKEDLEKIPEWERNSAWFIFRDSTFVNEDGETVREAWKIPKREVSKLIGNATESFVRFLFDRDPKGFAQLAEDTIENLSPIGIEGEGLSLQDRLASVVGSANPAFKAPIEYGTNYDTFRKKQTVPEYLKKKPVEEQAYKSTPKVYKAIGKKVGAAPLAVKQATDTITGGASSQVEKVFKKEPAGRSKLASVPFAGQVFTRSTQLKKRKKSKETVTLKSRG
jgi:hypothetical protein